METLDDLTRRRETERAWRIARGAMAFGVVALVVVTALIYYAIYLAYQGSG